MSGLSGLLLGQGGCWQASSDGVVLPDKIYGKFGYGPGQFQKPRAIAIDQQN